MWTKAHVSMLFCTLQYTGIASIDQCYTSKYCTVHITVIKKYCNVVETAENVHTVVKVDAMCPRKLAAETADAGEQFQYRPDEEDTNEVRWFAFLREVVNAQHDAGEEHVARRDRHRNHYVEPEKGSRVGRRVHVGNKQLE